MLFIPHQILWVQLSLWYIIHWELSLMLVDLFFFFFFPLLIWNTICLFKLNLVSHFDKCFLFHIYYKSKWTNWYTWYCQRQMEGLFVVAYMQIICFELAQLIAFIFLFETNISQSPIVHFDLHNSFKIIIVNTTQYLLRKSSKLVSQQFLTCCAVPFPSH